MSFSLSFYAFIESIHVVFMHIHAIVESYCVESFSFEFKGFSLYLFKFRLSFDESCKAMLDGMLSVVFRVIWSFNGALTELEDQWKEVGRIIIEKAEE